MSTTPTKRDFEDALAQTIATAAKAGQAFVDVRAGDLHTTVGGYPASNNRMPLCCLVMNEAKHSGDTELDAPPSGQGARLTIRYLLPRS